MKEVWKPIVLDGKEYDYEISNLGKVKNNRDHILRPCKRGQRMGTYNCVRLYKNRKVKAIDVHRLVALHFVPNPDDKPEVNHMDLNPFNNRVDNLEWVTRVENMRHSAFMRGTLRVEKQMKKYGQVVA